MTQTAIVAQADAKTLQQSVMQADHTYIHEELAYSYIEKVEALASAAQHYVSFLTPALTAKEIHFRPLGGSSTASGVTFLLFENVSSTGGAAKIPFNRYRKSIIPSTVVVKSAVAATPGTALIVGGAAAGAGGTPAKSAGGGTDGSANELILLPSTEYILEINNIGAVATDVIFGIFWYEETE